MVEFEWDDDNEEHIAERHNLTPDELEKAFADPRAISGDAYNYKGEKRFGLIGATPSGRLMYIIYTKRRGKIRIMTVKETNKAQKRRYNRR